MFRADSYPEEMMLLYAKNTSKDAVWRSDTALALYYAAQAMGFDKSNCNGGEVTDFDTIKWESRLFSDWEGEIPVKDGDNEVVS